MSDRPNHVTSRTVFSGARESIDTLRTKVINVDEYGETIFDFDRIIPMPEIIRNTQSSSFLNLWRQALGADAPKCLECSWCKDEGITSVEKLREHLEQCFPDGRQAAFQSIEAEKQTGSKDWYDWSCQNWGPNGIPTILRNSSATPSGGKSYLTRHGLRPSPSLRHLRRNSPCSKSTPNASMNVGVSPVLVHSGTALGSTFLMMRPPKLTAGYMVASQSRTRTRIAILRLLPKPLSEKPRSIPGFFIAPASI